MGAALGFLLGTGLSAAGGYAQQKAKTQHEHDNALFDFYSKNPQLVADSPDAQKFIKKYAGGDASEAFIGMAQHAKAASEQFGQMVNPPAQAGAAPQAGAQSGVQLPEDPKKVEDEMRKLEAFAASSDGQTFEASHPGLIKGHLAILDRHMERLSQQQAQSERQKEGIAARQEITPYQQAELGVRNKELGLRGEEVALSKQREAREATKAEAGGAEKPWTAKDAQNAVSKAEAQAKNELAGPAPWSLGLKARIPKGDEVKALAAKKLEELGLKPNGQRMDASLPKIGDVVSVKGQRVKITKLHPDGKTFDYEPVS